MVAVSKKRYYGSRLCIIIYGGNDRPNPETPALSRDNCIRTSAFACTKAVTKGEESLSITMRIIFVNDHSHNMRDNSLCREDCRRENHS